MNTTCPACQLTFDPGKSPGGHCPRCLLLGGADELKDGTITDAPPLRKCPTVQELGGDFPVYEIEALIGRGGMGAVYRARHRELNRRVAIKILLVDLAGNEGFEKRFRREARILASLDHPNIVRLYDFGRTPSGMCFLVMELIEGSDVSRMIREHRITVTKAMGMVIQICEALQYAHEQGLVHRDIKPSNVLVDDKTGRIHIADFGLAKLGADSGDATMTADGRTLGTPLYMAPEQRTSGVVDHRADIYSLGVMLYEMLTGDVPQGVFRQVSKKAPVNPGFDTVVNRAMKESPAERYQAASEVKAAVAALSGAAAVRQSRSRRVAAAAAIALLGAGGAYAYWNTRPPATTPGTPASDNPAVTAPAAPFKPFALDPSIGPGDRFSEAEAADLTARLQQVNPGFPGLTPDMRVAGGERRLKRWFGEVWLRLENMPSVVNLEPLRGSPFTHLTLSGTNASEIEVLKTMPLQFVEAGKAMDPAKLGELQLKHLDLRDVPSFRDLNLVAHPNLVEIYLSGSAVSDLTPLKKCPALQVLVADHCPGITSLEPLRGMSLRHVDIRKTSVKDFTPLTGQPLRHLRCDDGAFNDDAVAEYLSGKKL